MLQLFNESNFPILTQKYYTINVHSFFLLLLFELLIFLFLFSWLLLLLLFFFRTLLQHILAFLRDDFFEIFGWKHSIDSFGQDNVVARNIEVNAVFNCLEQINTNVHIARLTHARNNPVLLRHTGSKVDVVS